MIFPTPLGTSTPQGLIRANIPFCTRFCRVGSLGMFSGGAVQPQSELDFTDMRTPGGACETGGYYSLASLGQRMLYLQTLINLRLALDNKLKKVVSVFRRRLSNYKI